MYGLSKRLEGKPLKPPLYEMKQVPHYRGYDAPLLNSESVLYHIKDSPDRQDWKDSLGEMLLLCNEANRRSRLRQDETKEGKGVKVSSKPLSLEYMADRHDIDDPLNGYMIRTISNKQLQGFIQYTTFTTWQSTFRWDSMHEAAFSYDPTPLARQMARKERHYDQDGTLAAALQSTVRGGTVDKEGIVWPRICELSLLGALGCGRLLVDVMLESLEREYQSHSYDYVVVQATDNSIPFYESCGFKRVGAIVENPSLCCSSSKKKQATGENTVGGQPRFVTCPTTVYTTPKHSETPLMIAKKLQQQEVYRKYANLSAHLLDDIMFLNKPFIPTLKPNSKLWCGTELLIPDYQLMAQDSVSNSLLSDKVSYTEHGDKMKSVFASSNTIQWYLTNDNDTMAGVARKFNLYHKVLLKKFVYTNQCRIAHVTAQAVFKAGTLLQVSHLIDPAEQKHMSKNARNEPWLPYCHWTFPNEDTKEVLENTEATYLMCKKLNIDRGAEMIQSLRATQTKRAKPVKKVYISTRGLTQEEIDEKMRIIAAQEDQILLEERRKQLLNSSVDVDWKQKERLHKVMTLIQPYQTPQSIYDDVTSVVKLKKASLSLEAAQKMQRRKYNKNRRKKNLGDVHNMKPLDTFFSKSNALFNDESMLFNQVVKLNSQGKHMLYGKSNPSKYEYYYVLTFIPDLYWCHLTPMVLVEEQNRNCKMGGAPRWKLVSESLGEEIDISAYYCVLVPSKTIYDCEDADHEEWEINVLSDEVNTTQRDDQRSKCNSHGQIKPNHKRRTSATKESGLMENPTSKLMYSSSIEDCKSSTKVERIDQKHDCASSSKHDNPEEKSKSHSRSSPRKIMKVDEGEPATVSDDSDDSGGCDSTSEEPHIQHKSKQVAKEPLTKSITKLKTPQPTKYSTKSLKRKSSTVFQTATETIILRDPPKNSKRPRPSYKNLDNRVDVFSPSQAEVASRPPRRAKRQKTSIKIDSPM